MSDIKFPEDWHDFIREHQFVDAKQVYTNGSRLIAVFRVEQLIEHLFKKDEPVKPIELPKARSIMHEGILIFKHECPRCHGYVVHPWNACPTCGKKIRWYDDDE